MTDKQPRTLKQNGSLQKACRALGEKLNDGGLDMRTLLDPAYFGELEIPWNGDLVREHLFNTFSRIMYKKTSSELSTEETPEVWRVFIRHMGQNHGVTVDFPDRFNGGKC